MSKPVKEEKQNFPDYSFVPNIAKMLARNAANFFLRSAHIGQSPVFFRNIAATSVRNDIVKIQSTDDFKDKVINSKVPVVVDFFAT